MSSTLYYTFLHCILRCLQLYFLHSRYIVKGLESVVNYIPVTELDYGTLLCWAENDIGKQQVPCVFQILTAGLWRYIITIDWNCCTFKKKCVAHVINYISIRNACVMQMLLIIKNTLHAFVK